MDSHSQLYNCKKLQDKIATKSVNYILDNDDLTDTLASCHMELESIAEKFNQHLDTLSMNQAINIKESLINSVRDVMGKTQKTSKPRLIGFDPITSMMLLATGLEKAKDSKKRCINVFKFKKQDNKDLEVNNSCTIAQAKKLKDSSSQ